jgi:hypothetical protein
MTAASSDSPRTSPPVVTIKVVLDIVLRPAFSKRLGMAPITCAHPPSGQSKLRLGMSKRISHEAKSTEHIAERTRLGEYANEPISRLEQCNPRDVIGYRRDCMAFTILSLPFKSGQVRRCSRAVMLSIEF